MAYAHKDNPLNGVRVEVKKDCERKSHYVDMLIWGACTGCRRVIPMPNDTTKVFERLSNLKKLGV